MLRPVLTNLEVDPETISPLALTSELSAKIKDISNNPKNNPIEINVFLRFSLFDNKFLNTYINTIAIHAASTKYDK